MVGDIEGKQVHIIMFDGMVMQLCSIFAQTMDRYDLIYNNKGIIMEYNGGEGS